MFWSGISGFFEEIGIRYRDRSTRTASHKRRPAELRELLSRIDDGFFWIFAAIFADSPIDILKTCTPCTYLSHILALCHVDAARRSILAFVVVEPLFYVDEIDDF